MSSTPQHEPTMEEILASIRKIISEDTSGEAAEVAPSAPQAAMEADVLELTQEVVSAPAPEPVPEPASPMEHKSENDVVFETIEEPAVNSDPSSDNEIFSDHTRQALDDAFASLPEEQAAQPMAPRPAAPIAPVDGATVETVFERAVRESFDPVLHEYLDSNAEAVLERMKPMIREWMDEHFPALLEGVVRAEVERVLKARGKR